jgi:hypothetical protein
MGALETAYYHADNNETTDMKIELFHNEFRTLLAEEFKDNDIRAYMLCIRNKFYVDLSQIGTIFLDKTCSIAG